MVTSVLQATHRPVLHLQMLPAVHSSPVGENVAPKGHVLVDIVKHYCKLLLIVDMWHSSAGQT